MSRVATKAKVRCAIYTRKSTEEGLEQAFNSLDAQREACTAYIQSQRHEGWVELKADYDDGGYSGGTMERPALKRLMADVRNGEVDVIVVYKVDRLTRALSDFAKIVEILDARAASFVSVTQAFNTTSSMGRLTLNVLLSFAQFEREVTGERIRDKIAASKKKGMWMGGNVPLGYRVEDRKLLIEEAEAATVRHIFNRYAVLRSGRLLIEELRSDGYRTRLVKRRDGTFYGGVPFSRGMLFSLMSNRTYLGEIVHKSEIYAGEQEAIIDQALWDEVQTIIASRRVDRARGTNLRAPSLLVGILFDAHGRRLSPSHAVKNGKRYRYYVSAAADLQDGGPPAWRMPAHELEQVVIQRLVRLFNERLTIRDILAAQGGSPAALAQAATAANAAATKLQTHHGRQIIVSSLLQRVEATDDQIVLTLDRVVLIRMLGSILTSDPTPLILTASATRIRRGNEIKLVDGPDATLDSADPALLALLAQAQETRALILGAPEDSLRTIAARTGRCATRMSKLLRLSWLAPTIVETIVRGHHPAQLTARRLLEADLPSDWDKQRAMLGFTERPR